jgi:S1-C subfamily serine protease
MANRSFVRILLMIGLLSVSLAGCTLVARVARQIEAPLVPQTRPVVQVTAAPAATATPLPSPTMAPAPTATAVPTGAPTTLSGVLSDEEILDIAEALTVRVYEQVSPSVVYITSRVVQMDYWGYMYPSEGTGSGFVIDTQGHIVTNNHVVENAEMIEVTFFDGDIVEAELVGADAANDLAVIRVNVPADKLRPVDMSFEGPLKVGQRAIAIGNPYGLDWTLTTGVISSLGRPLQVSESRTIYDVVQTDAAINPGNSGGPLLNSHGQLIGVNTAIRQGAENIGFAVSLDTVRRVVPELIERGYYPHPWLGVLGYSLSPELARQIELDAERGLLVAQVYDNSPAAAIGMRGATRQIYVGRQPVYVGGDVLTMVDDQTITGNADLFKYLETRTRAGQVVTVTYIRDGQTYTENLTLGEEPR